MKTLTTTIAALLLASLAAVAAPGWQTDLEKALKQSKKEKKPVLIEFTGSDWCPPCIMMQKNVFSKKDFISKASKNFILVELDFPRGDPDLEKKNEPHAKKYKIEGFPTVVLLDENQKEFDRFFASKYPSVDKFLAHLDDALKKKGLE